MDPKQFAEIDEAHTGSGRRIAAAGTARPRRGPRARSIPYAICYNAPRALRVTLLNHGARNVAIASSLSRASLIAPSKVASASVRAAAALNPSSDAACCKASMK